MEYLFRSEIHILCGVAVPDPFFLIKGNKLVAQLVPNLF